MKKPYLCNTNQRLKQRISFPVGRVEYMSLRPCSFLEFLNATANEPLAEMIRQLNVSPIYHDMLIALFNKYTLVGGMPEALVDYATNGDVSRLSPIYRSLLNGYNEDVEKYAKNTNQANVIRHLLTHGWTEAGQRLDRPLRSTASAAATTRARRYMRRLKCCKTHSYSASTIQ